ncbi:hypothetical protein [Curtobacterium sp. MCBD17_040]|uniref:hypothetical protein n=1 Tax=Curtobacterium sp. MCBD17_040 TaxID=2175674 RepID=UPI0015E8BF39|nr:hypothetical protein [Curtobacterium sp. MCBD17_040]WIB65791.1 hypothetical protein DEI94_16890 [Curtobacterium sp. MCBD17_040]
MFRLQATAVRHSEEGVEPFVCSGIARPATLTLFEADEVRQDYARTRAHQSQTVGQARIARETSRLALAEVERARVLVHRDDIEPCVIIGRDQEARDRIAVDGVYLDAIPPPDIIASKVLLSDRGRAYRARVCDLEEF